MYVSINIVRISWCVADDFQPVPAKSAQQGVQRIWRWAPLFLAGSERKHCIRFVGWFSRQTANASCWALRNQTYLTVLRLT